MNIPFTTHGFRVILFTLVCWQICQTEWVSVLYFTDLYAQNNLIVKIQRDNTCNTKNTVQWCKKHLPTESILNTLLQLLLPSEHGVFYLFYSTVSYKIDHIGVPGRFAHGASVQDMLGIFFTAKKDLFDVTFLLLAF